MHPPIKSTGISFTALYTSAVWQHNGLSEAGLTPATGHALYGLLTPFESASQILAGGNIRIFLLQRHLIIDELIADAINNRQVTQILEVACGLSPRGIRLRKRFPQIHMVEADLPAMAARKAAYLSREGHLDDQHQVRPVDIFAESGPLSIEQLIKAEFDTNGPVLVITEGLTSYFSLDNISQFWQRLVPVFEQRKGSEYLSETYLQPPSSVFGKGLNLLKSALGSITRAQVSFHFSDDDDARRHLTRQGFSEVTVVNPEHWYGRLAIPHSRGNPLVRIIRAAV
ncbi:class I SAM-dependent methyltransferase [Marinobacter sp. 1Y8]